MVMQTAMGGLQRMMDIILLIRRACCLLCVAAQPAFQPQILILVLDWSPGICGAVFVVQCGADVRTLGVPAPQYSEGQIYSPQFKDTGILS